LPSCSFQDLGRSISRQPRKAGATVERFAVKLRAAVCGRALQRLVGQREPPHQASPAVAAQTIPRASEISARKQSEFVEEPQWLPISEAEAPAAAFPRRRTERSAAREMMSAPELRWFSPTSACPAEIAVAETRPFRRNSSDQCPWQSAQNPEATATTQKIADGRQQKCDRELIVFAARTPMPQAAAPFVQRFAVKLRAAVRGRSSASTACWTAVARSAHHTFQIRTANSANSFWRASISTGVHVPPAPSPCVSGRVERW
jgi:hypothetical protein